MRVGFHHAARQAGRAEFDDFRLFENGFAGANVVARALQHVGDMRDVIDHQPPVFDGHRNCIAHIAEVSVQLFAVLPWLGAGRRKYRAGGE